MSSEFADGCFVKTPKPPEVKLFQALAEDEFPRTLISLSRADPAATIQARLGCTRRHLASLAER
ncbi:MAG: hypothetical protein A2Z37_07815 [Chloroflexi bacterium RBG_19FT_COMBO_62_14]|nr:MAG: hypothetical protein A2Z37_07815 [Chloroflexi bacterium RBG_19FT_COMBO_62_14]